MRLCTKSSLLFHTASDTKLGGGLQLSSLGQLIIHMQCIGQRIGRQKIYTPGEGNSFHIMEIIVRCAKFPGLLGVATAPNLVI